MIISFREYWVALKRAVLVCERGGMAIFYRLRLRPRLATG